MPRNSFVFPQHDRWDEKTEKAVRSIRNIMYTVPEPTISTIQTRNVKSTPVQSPTCVSHVTVPVPQKENIRQALFDTVDQMGTIDYEKQPWAPVEAEWVTCFNEEQRSEVQGAAEPSPVIFYVHGGAFFQGSAGSRRPTTGQLARMTGGRCFSVDYRLSPQNTFPAALLDIILAYLELLYPSCSQSPVRPSNIVLAGDSAGANLCVALIQFILHMNSANSQQNLMFQGYPITLPLPAAITTLSLYADPTFSLPSHIRNMQYDLFSHRTPWSFLDYPACDIWPVSPQRANLYCHDLSNSHPLICPAMANSWKGSPPMWLCYGQEQMVDGGRVIAQKCINDGVTVIWEEFKAMPHCFAQIGALKKSDQVVKCWENWSEFIKQAVLDPTTLKSTGVIVGRDKETCIDTQKGSSSLLGGTMNLEEAKESIRKGMWSTHEWFQKQLKNASKL